jgi:hypothetical protein
MKSINSALAPNPSELDIYRNERDILRDLFIYMEYVSQRSVKRMTRTNQIPRADITRLAKLMDIDPPEEDDWMYARPFWINFIDSLARSLNLVSYETNGEYRGYSSSGPTFTENYILVKQSELDKFLNLSPVDQEKIILAGITIAKTNSRMENSLHNEFYDYGPLGILDAFDRWGSGQGPVTMIDFSSVREFLLNVLFQFEAGQWYKVDSIVAFLKAEFPHYLLPKELPKKDRWGRPLERYENFMEKPVDQTRRVSISANDPNAFERVEGRYVERFLEYLPLLMRFVELGYSREPYKGDLPSLGVLKAFKITERFHRMFSDEEPVPKVTVQPNFDVIVESEFFPYKIVRQLAAMGELVSTSNSTPGVYVGIFQLKKNLVAAVQAKQSDLDVSGLLKDLSGRDLPPNVQIELDEWVGHADQFTLYEGFALLETAAFPAELKKYVSEIISPALTLVSDPAIVFSVLETHGHVPIWTDHDEMAFSLLPEVATSLFPRYTPVLLEPQKARQVTLARAIVVSYRFPDKETFDLVCKDLAEQRCPFHTEPAQLSLSILSTDQPRFEQSLQRLNHLFEFEIDERQ